MPALYDADGASFDSLTYDARNELVVVDFWGPGCPNCELFAQAAPRLLQQLEGAPIRIVKVNAYENEELARRFGLFGIPTFLLIRDGRLLGRMSEFHGDDYWLQVVRDHLPT